MATTIFPIASLLAVLLMTAGTGAVDYTVTNTAPNTPSGARFDNEIGADYTRQILTASTDFIWSTFQQQDDADRKPVEKVDVFIDADIDGAVAYANNNEIHVSARAIDNGGSEEMNTGFAGVMYHEMAHVWQWNGNGQAPGGLIEGIADYVRLTAGYVPGHWVGPGEGDRWDQGYDVTARFLEYCEGLRSGFVAELNQKMRDGYGDGFFQDLTGNSVDQLWSDYKDTYGN